MKDSKMERRVRYQFYVILFSASIHLFAAALCLAPHKYHKLVPKWAKQAKSTVNMNKSRRRKKGFGIFEI